MAKLFPYSKVNGALSPIYAVSIHEDFQGEWRFNLEWKPVKGFPTYFAWILAIRKGHKSLASSNLNIPVLVLHSSASCKVSKYSDKAMRQDIVLNIEDIKRVSAKLGKKTTVLEIENAMHDVFLSAKKVREDAFKQMFSWIDNIELKK